MYLRNDAKQLKIAAAQNTRERDFWLNQLAGELVKNNFPYDHKESAGETAGSSIDSVTFTFPGEVAAELMEISKGDLYTINLVLITGIILLMYKYTGNNDITIGTPIYKQAGEGEFINTVLALRNRVEKEKTFKEFLLQVRQTINDAVENQNYPIEILAEQLKGITADSSSGFLLFAAAVLLENIHEKKYLRHINCDTIFSFRKEGQHIKGIVEYNSLLYEKTTVERIISHFTNLLQSAFLDANARLQHIQMLTKEQKNQLLYDFNNTKVEYPNKKTIVQWFAEQVEKTSHHIAVSSPIDLNDIYDQLESKTINPDLGQKMEILCFKKNSYVYQSPLTLPNKNENTHLQILKTHRHNSVIVNHHAAQLMDIFDGRRNLHVLYYWLKDLNNAREMPMEFLIYSMRRSDPLEISFEFDQTPEVFSIDRVTNHFEDFVQLVKSLYRHHLIELVGVESKNSKVEIPIDNYFTADMPPGLAATKIPENLLINDKEITTAGVLLLGDTPGTATTGLLYLGSYLKRNGINAYCQFYDPARNYIAMKENIEELLRKIQPAVVAISLKWFLYIARVFDMCRIIKEYARKKSKDIKVVIGGNTASYYWEEYIKNDFIDYLIRGDGEEPLIKICRGENETVIPNCIYKKNGEIRENPFIYVQDETNSSEIYLSHLDEIMLSHHASRFGTFFIVTHKGCAMNCLYCGGCNQAQQKTFNRKKVFKRGVKEVRKDILEALPFTSTFHFEFDILDKNLMDYCGQIWEGINLSEYFCVFSTLTPPADELIRLISKTFKYVYWDFDICTPSERHRKQLFSLGLVKPQPSDEDILDFMDRCEKYPNIEVRLNLITGLPYYTLEDIEPGEKLLYRIMNNYPNFGELRWARLHAQPGAPIVENAAKYHMRSYATRFKDFLNCSKENFNETSGYATVESFNYPYIYFNDDHLNSRVTNFYLGINKKANQYNRASRRSLIVCDSMTYGQLEKKAVQLADVLKAKGVKPGDIVGLMLEPSINIPVGILGILKTGCAYMPIDPQFPIGRIEYMLKDSSAKILVTSVNKLSKVRDINDMIEIIYLDKIPGEMQPLPTQITRPTQLCYAIYTSGTTGRPKGALISHQNLVNFMYWFTQKAQITEQDKAILTSSFAFDLGHTSIYPPLLTGGELHLLPRDIYLSPDRMLDYIYRKEITYIKVTPSLLKIIINSPGFTSKKCRFLRLAIVAGEPIDLKDIETVYSVYSHLEIMNSYGPTETTVACVTHNITFDGFTEYKMMPTIGKPIANARIYILDRGLSLMPMGVPGELFISGAGVGRGYLNQPELTAQRFKRAFIRHSSLVIGEPENSLTPNDRSSRLSLDDQYPMTNNGSYSPHSTYSTIYRSGDLARWLPDGNIEFLGRVDNQVKIRGYRIELGEIENRLKAHPRVEEAVVLVKEAMAKENTPENGDKYLCAYIIPKREKSAFNAEADSEKKILTSKDIMDTGGQREAKTLSILSLFQKQVKTKADKVAVKSKGRILTYYSLDRLAQGVAGRIIKEYDERYKLSKNERIRYNRQMLLHGWGTAFQEKLKSTTVFVAGAGGGASPTIMQLALMGIGTIKICDFDEVELSNLNRQFLHDVERIGMNKAQSAQVILNRINPEVTIIPIKERLTRDNVFEMVGNADIIFDMMDGPADKFTLSQCAVLKGIPHVIIAMADLNGFAAVLHTPHTPCYHCLFSKEKLDTITAGMKNIVDNYSKNPLAVVPAPLFISSGVVVNEVLKILIGVDEPAYNKFFYFNQRGGNENLRFSSSFKSMTHLFSDHFLQICKTQGFDWNIGWRGRYIEELNITSDPGCPICGTIREGKKAEKISVPRKVSLAGREAEKSPQTVGILLDMGINMAPANIGSLKAGKTPVLLDPSSSQERLCYILEDSEARVILTEGHLLPLAEKLRDSVNKNIKIIDIELVDQSNQGDEDLSIDLNPTPITCMIYPPDSGAPIARFYDALLHGAGGYAFENKAKQMEPNSLSSELTDYLMEVLPVYMIPSHFVKVEKIPLTPNGKVNIKSLPGAGTEENGEELVPTCNETEEKLVEIWAEVLEIEKNKIGIDSNFFQLGGHSLKATILIAKIHHEFDYKFPLNKIFETPNIRSISKLIRAAKDLNDLEIDFTGQEVMEIEL
jgi:amino acid adenylation domain-containing protein